MSCDLKVTDASAYYWRKIIPVSIPPLLKALPEIVFKGQGWGFSHVIMSMTAGYLHREQKEKMFNFQPTYYIPATLNLSDSPNCRPLTIIHKQPSEIKLPLKFPF